MDGWGRQRTRPRARHSARTDKPRPGEPELSGDEARDCDESRISTRDEVGTCSVKINYFLEEGPAISLFSAVIHIASFTS